MNAGWSGWRKGCGVICEKRVAAKVKGNVSKKVVLPAVLFGLETVTLTKREEAEMLKVLWE